MQSKTAVDFLGMEMKWVMLEGLHIYHLQHCFIKRLLDLKIYLVQPGEGGGSGEILLFSVTIRRD